MLTDDAAQEILERQKKVAQIMVNDGVSFYAAVEQIAEENGGKGVIYDAFNGDASSRLRRYEKAKAQGLTSTAGL